MAESQGQIKFDITADIASAKARLNELEKAMVAIESSGAWLEVGRGLHAQTSSLGGPGGPLNEIANAIRKSRSELDELEKRAQRFRRPSDDQEDEKNKGFLSRLKQSSQFLSRLKADIGKIVFPVAAAFGIVRLIEYLKDAREQSKRLGEEYQKVGDEFARQTARISASARGISDAQSEALSRMASAQSALRSQMEKDLDSLKGIGQFWMSAFGIDDGVASKAARINQAFADQTRRIASDTQKEINARKEKEAADSAKKIADQAIQEAKRAEDLKKEATLAGLNEEERVRKKMELDIAELQAKLRDAKSNAEKYSLDQQMAYVRIIADAQLKAIADAEEAKRAAEEAAYMESMDRLREQAVEQAEQIKKALDSVITDATIKLNGMLDTQKIEQGIDAITTTLQRIASNTAGGGY